jgi:hypothetical protein
MNVPGGSVATDFEFDVLSVVQSELSGDKGLSVRYMSTDGEQVTFGGGGTLTFRYVHEQVIDSEEVAHLPRSVRIIPYIRRISTVTGGYEWLLDQDSAMLKEMFLPRNIHFVLLPGAAGLTQYDPGDATGRASVYKKCIELWPDGTCTALAPGRAELASRVNTVWLHDAVTSDMAMLYVPPTSAFTRQRFLFGDEVETFIDQLGVYDLW